MKQLWTGTLVIALAALAAPHGATAQTDTAEAIVDTTFYTPDGTPLRYRGPLPAVDQPGSPERAEMLNTDDRVPEGYGTRTLRLWKPGDIRPEPTVTDSVVATEFVELHYRGPYIPPEVALAMAEYADYAYFAIKDRLGWTLDGPFPLYMPFDLKAYGKDYGLPWWVPGDVEDGRVILEPISVITSRGIALECLTHYYVEWQLRHRTGDRLPYWFLYGAGTFFGDEEWVLKGQVDVIHDRPLDISMEHMERDLEMFRDRALMQKELDTPGILEQERLDSRVAYWRAHRLVRDIMLGEGLAPFKRMVASMEADPALSFEDAVAASYGKSLDALLAQYMTTQQ